MNTKCLLDTKFGPAMIEQEQCGGYAIFVGVEPSTTTVFQFVVFLALHHLKIAWMVVAAIAVDMVDNFVRFQRAAKHLFRHQTVLVLVGFSPLRDDFVTATRDMSALPVGVFLAVQSPKLSLGNGSFFQLTQPGRAKGFVPKGFVLDSGHIVRMLQVGSANLFAAILTAKSAFDVVVVHISSYVDYTARLFSLQFSSMGV